MQLTEQIIGTPREEVTPHEERNGYLFWGLLALFIGVPEVLAALSHRLKDAIPWPTVSGLVGGHLEAHHHWTALVVMGLIVLVAYRTLTYPHGEKKLGQPLGRPAAGVPVLSGHWGLRYVVATAVVAAGAGAIAAAAGASKTTLGYAIYVPLILMGVVVPSMLRRWRNRVLSIPTLFATIELLRSRRHWHWVAAVVTTLLVLLSFHLALYPWPNYHFGTP